MRLADGRDDAKNGAFVAAVRFQNRATPPMVIDSPRFPQNFRKTIGNPRVAQMPPFCKLIKGRGLSEFWVKSWPQGGYRSDTEDGAFLAAIRVAYRASPDGDRLPRISPKVDGGPGQSMCFRNNPF